MCPYGLSEFPWLSVDQPVLCPRCGLARSHALPHCPIRRRSSPTARGLRRRRRARPRWPGRRLRRALPWESAARRGLVGVCPADWRRQAGAVDEGRGTQVQDRIGCRPAARSSSRALRDGAVKMSISPTQLHDGGFADANRTWSEETGKARRGWADRPHPTGPARPVRRSDAAEHSPNTADRPAVRPIDRGAARVVLRLGRDPWPLILGPRPAQGGGTQCRCTR